MFRIYGFDTLKLRIQDIARDTETFVGSTIVVEHFAIGREREFIACYEALLDTHRDIWANTAWVCAAPFISETVIIVIDIVTADFSTIGWTRSRERSDAVRAVCCTRWTLTQTPRRDKGGVIRAVVATVVRTRTGNKWSHTVWTHTWISSNDSLDP